MQAAVDVVSLRTIGFCRLSAGVQSAPLNEQPTLASRPRTFMAGLFDSAASVMPLPRLVPGPDWLGLQVLVECEPLAIEAGQTLAHRWTRRCRADLV